MPHSYQTVYYIPLYLQFLSHCPTIVVLSLLHSILQSVIPANPLFALLYGFDVISVIVAIFKFKVLCLIWVNRVPVSCPWYKD